MIKPEDLHNRQSIQQPRPFDFNEPSTLAPVSEPGDEDEPVAPPGEHAEVPHPRDTVVEGDEADE